MSLNFPNNPTPNSTYLDPNGRVWRFNNGYWQEDIPSFSIDLLRDVHTIFNTKSILFVSSDGTESSIDATVDLPFIQSDNTVSNIPFSIYGLPFYTADGTYDEIDIILNTPELDSVVVWKDPNWEPILLNYSTDDIIGLDLSTSVVDDVMIWETDKYVPDSKDNHTLQEIYDNVHICQIESIAIGATLTDCQTWYWMDYDTVNFDSSGTQADLANNRIRCESAGIYEIGQMMYSPDSFADSYVNKFLYDLFVYTSGGAIKYKYSQAGSQYYGWSPTYHSMKTIDFVELAVGDYIKYRLRRYQVISCRSANISHHYSTMYMKKIGTS